MTGHGYKWGMQLRIAIDMDGVLADFHGKVERALADDPRLSIAELVDRPGFFADLEPIEGARQVVWELVQQHEVFIASAAMDVPFSFADKYAWLRRHFDFIPPSHYVFCGDKAILDADVLIDDRARNFERFRGRPLLFTVPDNRSERRYERVDSWAEVRRLLLSAARAAAGAQAQR
jgi:5'-nucleotidase